MAKCCEKLDFASVASNELTNSGIQGAKAKAVGGIRKRCSKGKSCSATCIEGVKVCLVELPDVLFRSLSKVRDMILGRVNRAAPEPLPQKSIAPAPAPPQKPAADAKNANAGKPLGLFFSQALNRIRTLISRAKAEAKFKPKEVQKTPKETVQRSRASNPMTAIKQGEIPVGKVMKVRDNISKMLDKLKIAGEAGTVNIDGSEKADKVKWKAAEGSGARVIGYGGFGSFLKVPTKKLLGYSDGLPEEVGVKVGNIGRTEATLIKKLGELGLGPRLIASRFLKNAHSNTDSGTVHKGVIAMEIVPGVPLYKAPQKVNGVDKTDAYHSSMGKLHRLGFAHNDAKGDNLIIDDKGVARFVDLGMAQKNWKAALSEALGGWTGSNYVMPDVPRGKQDKIFKSNFGKVMAEMQKDGLTEREAKEIANFGIQHSAKIYNEGIWGRVSNQNARKYIKMYYNGIE